jgi:hypothetical protein
METNNIIELAKKVPYGTNTETKPYPISDKVPKQFLSQLGIELQNESNYVLIVEIQFDTDKIILQEYDELGENYDDFFCFNVNEIPNNFTKWIEINL